MGRLLAVRTALRGHARAQLEAVPAQGSRVLREMGTLLTVRHFMRILPDALDKWVACGWRVLAGHVSPSIGPCLVVVFDGDNPEIPE